MADMQLRVRKTPTSPWIVNFSSYGWTYIDSTGARIQLTPYNTKLRSADGTSWLNVK